MTGGIESSKKRPRLTEGPSKETQTEAVPGLEIEAPNPEDQTAVDAAKQIVKSTKQTTTRDVPEDVPILKGFTRSSVPPRIVSKLMGADIIGHVRPATERFIDNRFYEVDPAILRAKIKFLLETVLPICFHNKSRALSSTATSDIAQMVPLTVDACMIALYAKMRVIHKQFGKYATRYTTPASYNKDVELPLPLADAISDFGIFESTCAANCYVYVPVFPEGTKFEGRSTEEWNSNKYDCCCEIYRKLNIPLRNVDTRVKTGSAWWTYVTGVEYNTYYGTMIVPPLHYSDHSATVASLLLSANPQGQAQNFIKKKDDDPTYGKKFRLLRPGVQINAFMALAQMPEEDWNAGSVTGQT